MVERKVSKKYFLRWNNRPDLDLERGYSYAGEMGDEELAHEGLSGYEINELIDALQSAYHYALNYGGGSKFLTLWEGRWVGTGPSMEDLFAPIRIIFSFPCGEITNEGMWAMQDLIEAKLRELHLENLITSEE